VKSKQLKAESFNNIWSLSFNWDSNLFALLSELSLAVRTQSVRVPTQMIALYC